MQSSNYILSLLSSHKIKIHLDSHSLNIFKETLQKNSLVILKYTNSSPQNHIILQIKTFSVIAVTEVHLFHRDSVPEEKFTH